MVNASAASADFDHDGFPDILVTGSTNGPPSGAFTQVYRNLGGFQYTAATSGTESLAFDPYPFIFLNLMLSMLAAIQAPVIMMSQNRAAARDREAAGHDYTVNLRAELEIMHLHDKIDTIREKQMLELLKQQREALRLLKSQVEKLSTARKKT